MKSIEFHPDDYDRHGLLRLPFLFWCVLLLQARTWVLFMLAGASRQQGDALLSLFYPDRESFWLGLLPGAPAVLAFIISGRRRHFPRLWPRLRGTLIVAQLCLLLWQGLLWRNGEPPTATTILLLTADLYALWWLFASRRLRACFLPDAD